VEKPHKTAERWRELLAADDIALTSGMESGLQRHTELVREWNPFLSLVSTGDASALWERHVLDAISLAPWVKRLAGEASVLLDIGTGGGYPAIPLKILLPGLPMTLIERSERKAGFLRKVIGELKLQDVTLCVGEFPRALPDVRPSVITARAIEQPQKVWTSLQPLLKEGAIFLCQAGKAIQTDADMFHVEPIHDSWTDAGYRRGTLSIIRKT
jgi:16S rRNA (guanine527-N7)-methyltransferase